VLATSDVPAGVVNVLTGRTAEVSPWLASHADVNAIDLAGAALADGVSWADLEVAAADNVKRVLRPAEGDGEPTWAAPPPGPARILAFTETKTVWHPKGP
jgi:acyl-CoA reductase-like NAD-dependent aldehyde dehydrogenase